MPTVPSARLARYGRVSASTTRRSAPEALVASTTSGLGWRTAVASSGTHSASAPMTPMLQSPARVRTASTITRVRSAASRSAGSSSIIGVSGSNTSSASAGATSFGAPLPIHVAIAAVARSVSTPPNQRRRWPRRTTTTFDDSQGPRQSTVHRRPPSGRAARSASTWASWSTSGCLSAVPQQQPRQTSTETAAVISQPPFGDHDRVAVPARTDREERAQRARGVTMVTSPRVVMCRSRAARCPGSQIDAHPLTFQSATDRGRFPPEGGRGITPW